MAAANRQAVGQSKWHNHYPVWIDDDADISAMLTRYPATRRVLQAIADAGERQADGAIMRVIGGNRLAENAGCSKSTFWEAIKRLEHHGVIILTSRGGTVTFNGRRRNASSTYAIPASKGALDSCKVRREVRHRVKDGNGKLRSVVISPGAQATLFHPDELSRPPTASSISSPIGQGLSGHRTGVVRSSDMGSPLIGHSHHSVSYPDSHPDPMKHHGSDGGVRANDGRMKRRGKRWIEVSKRVFCDYDAMVDLYGTAMGKGMADGSEHGWKKFVAMVCHCNRLGRKNPEGMLGTNLRLQRWDRLSERDFDDADELLEGRE